MAEKGDGLSRFLYRVRHQRLSPRKASAEENVEWHRDAVQDAFGLTLEQFDEQWREFVRHYPRR